MITSTMCSVYLVLRTKQEHRAGWTHLLLQAIMVGPLHSGKVGGGILLRCWFKVFMCHVIPSTNNWIPPVPGDMQWTEVKVFFTNIPTKGRGMYSMRQVIVHWVPLVFSGHSYFNVTLTKMATENFQENLPIYFFIFWTWSKENLGCGRCSNWRWESQREVLSTPPVP